MQFSVDKSHHGLTIEVDLNRLSAQTTIGVSSVHVQDSFNGRFKKHTQYITSLCRLQLYAIIRNRLILDFQNGSHPESSLNAPNLHSRETVSISICQVRFRSLPTCSWKIYPTSYPATKSRLL